MNNTMDAIFTNQRLQRPSNEEVFLADTVGVSTGHLIALLPSRDQQDQRRNAIDAT
jgi:hypothetical protein